MTERDYGRRFFTAWAIVFGASTIILNAVESGRLNSGWGNILGASATGALPPIILLVTTHAATIVVRRSSRASRVTFGFGIALGGGALASGAMAFGGSFTALTALATHWHWSTPVFLPLSLDIALLTMSLGSVWTALMVASEAEAAEEVPQTAGAEPVLDTPRDAVTVPLDAAVQAVLDTRDTAVLDTPADTPTPVSWTHRVMPGQQVEDSRDGQSAEGVTVTVTDSLDTAPQAADLGVDSVTAVLDTARPAVHDTRDSGVADTVLDSPDDTRPAVIPTVTDTPDDSPRDTVTAAVDTVIGVSTDLRDIASEVVAEVGTSADVDVVERVLELALDGLSARKISEALAPDGPSRTPVAAWVKAAKDQPGFSALATAGRPRPQLVAVND